MKCIKSALRVFSFFALIGAAFSNRYDDTLIDAYDFIYDGNDKILDPRKTDESIIERESDLTTRLAHLVGLSGNSAGTNSIDDIYRVMKKNINLGKDKFHDLTEDQKTKAQQVINHLTNLYIQIPNGYLPGTGPLEEKIKEIFDELKIQFPIRSVTPSRPKKDPLLDTPEPPADHPGI